MRKTHAFVPCWMLFFTLQAQGRAFNFTPVPEPETIVAEFGMRSDLWTSPMVDKRSPVRIYDGDIIAPVVRSSRWVASLKFDTEGLSSGRPDLVVGPHHVLIGSDLRMQEYGVHAQRRGEDESRFAFSAAYASASDEPYRHSRDAWPEVQSVYVFPMGAKSYQWVIAVNYSKNRGFLNNRLLPMGGVSYRPNPNLSLILGFPFLRAVWKDDLWDVSALALPAGFHLSAERNLGPTLTGLARMGVANRAYLHENRWEDDMRLFFQETYADGGFRTRLTDTTSIEGVIGASFDRSFYEAKQVYQPVGNRTTLPADFYGRLGLEFRL